MAALPGRMTPAALRRAQVRLDAKAFRRDHHHRQGPLAVPDGHGATDHSAQVQVWHLGDYDASLTQEDVG